MNISKIIARFPKNFNSILLYSAVIFLLYFSYQIIQPIRMGDTDMWYHLNGGRYFWETLTIPATSFFSYIEPERVWTNYYWGFQAILFKIYSIAEYHSLIIFRAILTTGTLFLVFLYLKKASELSNEKLTGTSVAIPVLFAIFALIIITYDPRAYQLRPHLFSYFLIITFLLILEFKPKAAPVLPFLTVFWANTHGVEWPAGALICGSYALPVMIKLYKKEPFDIDRGWVFLGSLLLCAPALMVTPYGWEIYLAPFNVPGDVYLYTNELTKLSILELTTVKINFIAVNYPSTLAILFLLSGILFIIGLLNKSISLPHIILYLGGLLLLAKGTRFIWEWLLLSTPIIASIFKYNFLSISSRRSREFLWIYLIAFSLLLPTATLYNNSKKFGQYPLDSSSLPINVYAFLNGIEKQGKLLAPPSEAGFTEWTLYPKYKTFIDMQFPPFLPSDYFPLKQAYQTESGLKKFIENYDPDWILLPKGHSPSKKHIKKIDNFVPVFFDDIQVLYADKNKFPDIIEIFEIKTINPHNLIDKSQGSVEELIAELEKMHTFAPRINRINHALARLYFAEKKYHEALKYAENLIENEPLNNNGFYLAGISLQNLDRFDEAINMFKSASKISGKKFKKVLFRSMASTYYLKKDFTLAYKYFKKSINPYKEIHKSDDLYMYAFSAVMLGELEDAKKLLTMTLYQIEPENNQRTFENATAMLEKLNQGEFDTPSVFNWIKSLVGLG